jgi:hypothetical protein
MKSLISTSACGVSHLIRVPLQAGGLISRKPHGLNASPYTFGLKNEHVFCASVRGCFTRYSAETNAPAKSRFPRQRASSRSRKGQISCSFNGYVLVHSSKSYSKALGVRVTTEVPGVTEQIGEGNPCVW